MIQCIATKSKSPFVGPGHRYSSSRWTIFCIRHPPKATVVKKNCILGATPIVAKKRVHITCHPHQSWGPSSAFTQTMALHHTVYRVPSKSLPKTHRLANDCQWCPNCRPLYWLCGIAGVHAEWGIGGGEHNRCLDVHTGNSVSRHKVSANVTSYIQGRSWVCMGLGRNKI